MFKQFKKIWWIFTPAERRRAGRMLVLAVFMAAVEAASVLSIIPFLTVLARPAVVDENPWLQAVSQWLAIDNVQVFVMVLGLVSMAVVLMSSAFKIITHHLISRFVHLQRHSISSRLLARYLAQPYEFFLTRNSSVLGQNVLSEVNHLLDGVIQPVSQLIAHGVMLLAMLLLVLAYNPLIALGVIGMLGVLYGGIYSLLRNKLLQIGYERKVANGERSKACHEALGGIKDVQVTGTAEAYLLKFREASRRYSRHMATSETLAQSPLYLIEALGFSSLIIVALVLLGREGSIVDVLPAIGLYGFAAYRMLPSAQVLYRNFARMRFSEAVLDGMLRDLALPMSSAVQKNVTPMRPMHEIRLVGVRYAYPSSPDKHVLDGVDLVIPAGSRIGIAGRSGAGKSTLMDILLGLLVPQEGSLIVDGVKIDAGNLRAWQAGIGYVPQHIFLADVSVAENIAFGVPEDAIDMQAVDRAARAAQIHDFVINELPQGYNTRLGERGIRLSGGQRQRIGIARALYADPSVLCFDEATSALDLATEKAVSETIGRLPGGKTIIVIAHREAALKVCSEIVEL